MGIKFSDIIALAKSGYTVSDVKELMQLSETPSNNDETEAPQDNQEPAAEDPEEPEQQEEVDYKTLYEQEQEKVKRLQAVNRNQNAQTNEKTDQEILMDLARDFM